ncbi:membrane cofactor protein-like isoform X2 [Diceros bicornis minor]|uniref:membrane cofactor protein-like isoform X2 n=1 Tax=Diceros bicornis minor TaxID=77932 RepID=UPI0026F2F4A0|nr:membrane cofactor protein-like isoform X2 [Diceros bicornis minor]
MTASCAPRTAPPCRPESHFSSWGLVGVLLGALVLLLPVSSDACRDPPRFNSMKLKGVTQSSYSPGDTIEYVCLPGYKLERPPLNTSAACQPDNTWTPLQEACTRKLCPPLQEPTNGRINYVNGTLEFGSQVRYVCNEGYYLTGQNILTCKLVGDNVHWSDIIPQCNKLYCQPPPKIQNGKYTRSDQEKFTYNDVVTYSCDPSDGPEVNIRLLERASLFVLGITHGVVTLLCVKWSNVYIQYLKMEKWYQDFEKNFTTKRRLYLNVSRVFTSVAATQWSVVLTVLGSLRCQRALKKSFRFLVQMPAITPKCLIQSTLFCFPVSTLPSTKPPNSSISGHPSPSDGSLPLKHMKTLGGGIIALIVVTVRTPNFDST